MRKIQGNKRNEKKGKDAFSLNALAAVLAILIIASLAYAQTNILSQSSQWIIVAIIAVSASYVLVSAVYMFAKALDNAEFVSWANNEFFQVTATLFIVFILFFSSAVEDYVINNYVESSNEYLVSYGYKPHTGQAAQIAAAQAYLNMVGDYVLNRVWTAEMVFMGLQAALTSMMAKESLFGGLIVLDFEEIRSTIGKPMAGMYSNVMNALFGAWGVTIYQVWFLDMIYSIGFTLILPIGIVLRCTPFMRKTGSAMIAIAIGFYLIYPLTFLLNYQIVETLEGKDWVKTPAVPGNVLEQLGEVTLFGTGFLMSFRDLSMMGRFSVAITNLLAAIPLITALEEAATFAVVVFAIILPILDVVITFGITREIAQLLGADVSLDSILQII